MRIYNPIHFWRTFWAYWNEFDGQPICKRPRRRLHSSWVQTTCVLVPWIDWPKHKFKLPSDWPPKQLLQRKQQ
jgi:hypothetical protein